jgi:hypothetical protein
MDMISITIAQSRDDLEGILSLQKLNLPASLAPDEMQAEGFVTVQHRLPDLLKMSEIEPSIVAKSGGQVIAYLLAMTVGSKEDIPELVPMFQKMGSLSLGDNPISSLSYIVVGQACVAKGYRGMGLLDQCYTAYKARFQSKYGLAITEIDTQNHRSLNAHRRIGFQELLRYMAPNQREWAIVAWDWK